MYSAYKLNKQGDNIQPWRTSFPILFLKYYTVKTNTHTFRSFCIVNIHVYDFSKLTLCYFVRNKGIMISFWHELFYNFSCCNYTNMVVKNEHKPPPFLNNTLNVYRDFPGGPVAMIPPSQCRVPGFDPRPGSEQRTRGHMLQLDSPCCNKKDSTCLNQCSQ